MVISQCKWIKTDCHKSACPNTYESLRTQILCFLQPQCPITDPATLKLSKYVMMNNPSKNMRSACWIAFEVTIVAKGHSSIWFWLAEVNNWINIMVENYMLREPHYIPQHPCSLFPHQSIGVHPLCFHPGPELPPRSGALQPDRLSILLHPSVQAGRNTVMFYTENLIQCTQFLKNIHELFFLILKDMNTWLQDWDMHMGPKSSFITQNFTTERLSIVVSSGRVPFVLIGTLSI